MATISDALVALGITEWKLDGEPTSAEEFASTFKKITGTDANGQVVYTNDTSKFGTTCNAVNTKKTELTNGEGMKFLRAKRDSLLSESDWMANSDVTMSDAWKTYRQALRDITDSATSLDDVTWPTKPS